MRIVCISDTHNQHNKLELPDGDVLIHAGDATIAGKPWELFPFIEWMGAQSHTVKLFVPGNHDFDVERDVALYRRMCYERGVLMLIDEAYTLTRKDEKPLKFYGAPWVPNLIGWAFYQPHLGLVSKFAKIPNDTNVLITHGPPEGVLDVGPVGNAFHIGSSELRDRVAELGELRLHCFGHIHRGSGVLEHGNGRYSVNASVCNEAYEAVNPPRVVEL